MQLSKNISFRFVLFTALFFYMAKADAQELAQLRHCKTSTYKMDFYILTTDKKVHYSDTLFYTWFKSQQLYETQGRSSGNLLHGNFSKYYVDGQLAEQGDYRLGLKDGEWVSWYSSGRVKRIWNYKKGVLNGKFMVFDETGKLIEEGCYRKGEKKIKREKKPKEKELNEEPQEEKETADQEEKTSWFKRMDAKLFPEGAERTKKREERRAKREMVKEERKRIRQENRADSDRKKREEREKRKVEKETKAE